MSETTTAPAAPATSPAGDPETERIRQRVHQKAEFYRHVVAFAVVCGILAAIDLFTTPGILWFYWPMGAWSIGLALHFADVWVIGEGAGMEERMLEREMERQREAHG